MTSVMSKSNQQIDGQTDKQIKENTPSAEKKKLVHLEAFRILAIYLVMFNHTDKNGFFFFTVAQASPFYGLYLFISIACKFAVPLFYMVSGALLLKKEESIGVVYKKRFLRMLII